MATSTNQYEIVLGSATTSTSQFLIIAPGAQGDPSALRTLTHPALTGQPVTYQRNPDRTINFGIDPLNIPTSARRKTQGTTLPFQSQNAIHDVLVTERWLADRGTASMTGAFFRRLLELMLNPPIFISGSEVFVVWAPNDLRDDGRSYNIVLMDLRVGGRTLALDVKEHGKTTTHFDHLDNVKTGILDRVVELDFLIRSVAS